MGIKEDKARDVTINFCIQNNFLTMKKFPQNKEIQKIKMEVRIRMEISIIDYILISRNYKWEIRDMRITRQAELNSDHCVLVARRTMGRITDPSKNNSEAVEKERKEVERREK